MIAKMDRIELVFLRSELSDMVAFLQDQGVLHVEEAPLALESHPGYLHRVSLPEKERRELAALTELEGLVREARPLLSSEPTHIQIQDAGPRIEDLPIEEQRTQLTEWHHTLRALNRRKLDTQDAIAVLENYASVLRAIAPMLSAQKAQLGKNARAFVLEGYTEHAIATLEQKFRDAAGTGIQFTRHTMGKNRTALVVIHPEDKAEAINTVIREQEIIPVDSPDKDIAGDSVPQVLDKINKKVATLRADLDQALSELQVYSEAHGAQLAALDAVVSNRINQLNVVSNFAQSEMLVVVHGWLPHEDFNKFRSSLRSRFGNRAALGKLPLSDVDLHEIPTKRELPAWVQPFELIMNMMKPTTYGSFDPTILVALSFVFFYGFIVGDAGYGLTMLLIGWLVKKSWGHIKLVKDGATIFQFMGASATFFGILYGEYFGDTVLRATAAVTGNPHPHIALFHRAGHEGETTILLYLAILVGAIHVPLALILGIREGYAHGHTKHAEERLGMLLGLLALVVALVSGAGYFPLGGMIGGALAVALLVVAVVLFIRSMGAMAPMGVIEIVGLSANILSYARLMALGIAGIAFADIANKMPAAAAGALIVVALLGAVLVHAFNFALSAFSPAIHSLRLNLVEFLPKFYEPHGRSYEPFRKDMAW